MAQCLECPACGDTMAGRPIHSGEYIYRVCGHCGHGILDPIPSVGHVGEIYEKTYFQGGTHFGYNDYGADEGLHRQNARHRLEAIRRVSSHTGGRFLDFGCAYGYFLAEAEKAGWRGTGVEISAWARQEAQKISGAPVVESIESLSPEYAGTFDMVCFFQVLEHCREPLQMLRTAHMLLKPDGFIVLETWDKASFVARAFGNRWQQISPPSVIHLFTRSSLAEMMQRSGFEVPSIRATWKLMSLGTVMGIVGQKMPFLKRVPGWALFTKATRAMALPYFMPDLIFVSAKKRQTKFPS